MPEKITGSSRRFYVYHHICKIDFILDFKEYKKGDVVYIGSGTARRFKDFNRNKRSKKHTLFFDKIDPVIVYDNLTLEEKYELEQSEIDKYWNTGLLINHSNIVRKPKKISYEYLSQFLEIDETSESMLVWKKSTSARYKDGEEAGSKNKSNGYWYVTVEGSPFRVNRVVYCLYNKTDISENLVIDHIDRQNWNNHPSNLRLVSSSKNNINRNFYIAKSEGVIGVRWDVESKNWRAYVNVDHKQIVKVFTPRKLFPELPLEQSKQLCFDLAVKWRREMESVYYA